MKRAMITMGVIVGICALGQAFCIGLAIGRTGNDCQLQASNERQLSPHEQESGPTTTQAPARWNEER